MNLVLVKVVLRLECVTLDTIPPCHSLNFSLNHTIGLTIRNMGFIAIRQAQGSCGRKSKQKYADGFATVHPSKSPINES